jgi:hypothetical protein
MALTAIARFRELLAPPSRAGAAAGTMPRRRIDTTLRVAAAIGFAIWLFVWAVILTNRGLFERFYGQDVAIYLEAADRWLHGGGFYNAYQLAGPYAVSFGDILYPPFSLALFVPFTAIPAPLWWAIPLALVGTSVWRLRPAPWALAAIVACLWWPDTMFRVILGNPVLWVVALLALGTTRPFFAPFALIKFTLAPAAILNVRQPAWWIGLAVLGIMSLLFLPLWPGYLTALTNLRTGAGWAYSIRELPMIAIPWIAWLGRARTR